MSGIGTVAATSPYPWPWDGGCSGERLALVVAGWDPGWRGRADADRVVGVESVVADLAAAVAVAGGTVVVVRHGPPPRGQSPSPSTSTSMSTGTLDPPRIDGPAVVPIAAAGIDGFHGSGLDAALRAAGATHLLLAGNGLEAPVHSTLRSANDRGYECLLVLDACAPLIPDLTAPARSMVEMSGGIFGAVGTTADVLAALVAASEPEPAVAT